MTDATAKFFDELASRGHEPLLEKATGTVRFDLRDGKRTDQWLLTVTKGDVTVSHENAEADGVLRAEKALFDLIAAGEMNVMAAMLRGAVAFEGDPAMAVLFQRLFPGPPGSRDRRHAAGYARRQS